MWYTRTDKKGTPSTIQFIEVHQSGQAVVIDFLGRSSVMKIARGEDIWGIEQRAEEIVQRDLKKYG